MGTAHKGFEAQLGSYRFILSPGTVFMKISNPVCIKQSPSAFHFSISAISPKGNPESVITSQKCRTETQAWEAIGAPGGSCKPRSPGSG